MDWTLFLLFLLACAGAAATGVLFQPGKWYDALEKPAFTPPNWMFPVVWTTLYILIALAAARVAPEDGSGLAMAFFAVQLAFNAIWTPIFFGLHKMKTGLVIIGILWLAVAGTLWQFWQIDVIAGLIFIPYLAWVSVAFALNASVWRLNPDRATAT